MPSAKTTAGMIAYEALDLLGARMQPFVAERLQGEFGPDWASMLLRGQASAGDPAWQLSQIRDNWAAFERALPPTLTDTETRAVRNLAFELVKCRNQIGHHELREGATLALRTVDLVDRLVRAFGLADDGSASEIERMRVEAARLLAGGGAVPSSAELRAAYIESVLAETAHLDLRGISTPDPATIVRLGFGEIFVAPMLREAQPVQGRGRGRREPADAPAPPAGQLDPAGEGSRDEPCTIEDLQARRRIVILGGPGAGKTTLLKHLARSAVLEPRADRRLPILCPAPRFADARRHDGRLTLRRFIASGLTSDFGDVLDAALTAGEALVLVDGLDEIDDDVPRAQVSEEVDALARLHPGVSVWASSRSVGYADAALGPAFRTYELLPFDDEQIRAFLGNWLAAVGRVDATEAMPTVDELMEELEANPDVRELARTPLWLTLIALLRQTGNAIPSREIELLRLATATLLREWPLHRLKLDLDERDMLAALQPIAHGLVASGQGWVRQRDVIAQLTARLLPGSGGDEVTARAHALELLRVIERATGCFTMVGRERGEPTYGFVHRRFGEYFAARHLADQWAAGELDLAAYVHRRVWESVLVLLVAHVDGWGEASVTRLAQDLLNAWPLDRHTGAHRRFVAAVLLRSGVRVRSAFRDELARGLVRDYLDPRFDLFRDETATALENLGPAACAPAAPLLTAHADDSDQMLARKRLVRWFLEPTPDGLAEILACEAALAATYAGDPGLAAEVARRVPGVFRDDYAGDEDAVLIGLGPLAFDEDFAVSPGAGTAYLADAGVPLVTLHGLAERISGPSDLRGWWAIEGSLDERSADACLRICDRAPARPLLRTIANLVDRWELADDIGIAAPEHLAGFLALVESALIMGSDFWVPPLRAILDGPDPDLSVRAERALVTQLGGRMGVTRDSHDPLDAMLGLDDLQERRDRACRRRLRLLPLLEPLELLESREPVGEEEVGFSATARADAAARPEPWMRLAACDSLIEVPVLTSTMPGGEPIPWDALLAPIRPLRGDPDARVRGAACRAVVAACGTDAPFSLLAEDILADITGHELRFPGATELCLLALVARTPSLAPSERARWADAIRRLVERLEHLPRVFIPGALQPSLGIHPEVEAVLIEVLRSAALPPRVWAAAVLAHLARTQPAGAQIGALLSAADRVAQLAAVKALTDIDFEDPDWVPSATVDFLEVADEEAARGLGEAIRVHADEQVRSGVALLLDAALDETPGDRARLAFADALTG